MNSFLRDLSFIKSHSIGESLKQRKGECKVKVTFIEKGKPFDYKRIDRERSVYLYKSWRSGGLLYGYVDRFNIITIEIDSIISIEE